MDREDEERMPGAQLPEDQGNPILEQDEENQDAPCRAECDEQKGQQRSESEGPPAIRDTLTGRANLHGQGVIVVGSP
jgi:hypothetical protein